MNIQRVIVRTYRDVPVLRWSIGEQDGRVLICNNAVLAEVVAGRAPRPDCFPIAFRPEWVFFGDEDDMSRLNGVSEWWNKLRPYAPAPPEGGEA